MELVSAVAENVRRIRKTQKMSMERAAKLSGVSKSMLGQIERGTVNPTVAVLEKLAAGLRVSVTELVEQRGERPDTLYRGADAPPRRLNGGRVIVYPLLPFDAQSRCESCQMDLFITGSYQPEDCVPHSRVYVTVLSGTLTVETDGAAYRLESRDSLSLRGDRPYRLRNAGSATVRLICRTYYAK